MRERGNIWPVISVALGAFLVLFVLPLIIQRQRSGEMATVEAHVSIGETGTDRILTGCHQLTTAGRTARFHARQSAFAI